MLSGCGLLVKINIILRSSRWTTFLISFIFLPKYFSILFRLHFWPLQLDLELLLPVPVQHYQSLLKKIPGYCCLLSPVIKLLRDLALFCSINKVNMIHLKWLDFCRFRKLLWKNFSSFYLLMSASEIWWSTDLSLNLKVKFRGCACWSWFPWSASYKCQSPYE